MQYDGSQAIRNMDDVLFYGRTLEELKAKLETFLGFCEEKNLTFKPLKMTIGEEVEFGGTVIRAETVENEDVVSILPLDKRVKAFFDYKNRETKKEIQVLCGMLSSLQIWNPSLPLNLSMLRKATATGKIIWNDELEKEYNIVIRAETVENEDVVSILPWDKRLKAFFDLKSQRRKRKSKSCVEY